MADSRLTLQTQGLIQHVVGIYWTIVLNPLNTAASRQSHQLVTFSSSSSLQWLNVVYEWLIKNINIVLLFIMVFGQSAPTAPIPIYMARGNHPCLRVLEPSHSRSQHGRILTCKRCTCLRMCRFKPRRQAGATPNIQIVRPVKLTQNTKHGNVIFTSMVGNPSMKLTSCWLCSKEHDTWGGGEWGVSPSCLWFSVRPAGQNAQKLCQNWQVRFCWHKWRKI